MRKTLALATLCCVAGFALAQSGQGLLDAFAKALDGAQTLSTTYTVQTIGSGAPETYTLDLKKPNQARIDEPTRLIVADGKTITSYDKAQKTYFQEPQSDKGLAGLFTPDELNVWSGFFGASTKPVATKDLGKTTIKGVPLSAVQATMDAKGAKTVTYYLSATDNVARKAQIANGSGDDQKTTIIDAKSLALGSEIPADRFAFTAPDGAHQITAADLASDQWYTNLDEAMKAAASSHRIVMVDFYADW